MTIDALTVRDVAALYSISLQRVRFIAKHRHLGTHIGGIWLFTRAEAEAMKPGKGGRPRKYGPTPEA